VAQGDHRDGVSVGGEYPGMLTDHAKELHRRTLGLIASLTNVVDRLCDLAIGTGLETITADLLAAAVADNAAQTISRAG
jgi:hypothetical protein